MDLPVWFEIGSLVVLILILVGDLLLIVKRPHIPSTKESTLWVVFYVILALIRPHRALTSVRTGPGRRQAEAAASAL